MIRPRRQLIALLVVVVTACLPASALAGAGGAAPGVLTLPGPPATVVHLGNPLLSASANGASISLHATALLRGSVRIAGSAPAQAGGVVQLERLDAQHGWVAVATAAVAAGGGFHALWHPSRVGTIELRAVPASTSGAGAADAAGSVPQLGVTVYRPGVASWYGLAGTTTACGVTLAPGTLGVAHRTLPCGTSVALYYRGRTLVVPVIDRGPYMAGRSWDLTRATFRGLGGGAEGLITLGALPLPLPTPPAN